MRCLAIDKARDWAVRHRNVRLQCYCHVTVTSLSPDCHNCTVGLLELVSHYRPGASFHCFCDVPVAYMEKLLLTRMVARLILGVLQIAGATAATIYLFSTGASAHTCTAVGITAIFTLLSRILFRRERALERSRRATDQAVG